VAPANQEMTKSMPIAPANQSITESKD
jgi:hypothetical protein